MKKAFLANAKAASSLQGAHIPGRGMLAFYSVECGLKYVIMVEKRYRSTDQVASFGHSLQNLIREANISAAELSSVPTVKVQSTGNTLSCGDWHTAWRYGVEMVKADCDNAIEFLDDAIVALKKRING